MEKAAMLACVQQRAAGLLALYAFFRNIAVHDYQILQLPIIASIIEKHLHEFLYYSKALLLRDADSTSGVMP